MNSFFTLTRVNLNGLLLFRGKRRKSEKKAASSLIALLFIAGFSLYIGFIYSFVLFHQFASIGAADLALVLMAIFAAFGSFMFCFFNAAGFVFGGRDNDLLLSLPVSAFVLVLSKLIALYVETLLCCLCILLPATVVHLLHGGVPKNAVLFFVPVILLLPLLPTALSLVFAFILSWFESRARFKALISAVVYLVFFGVLMLGSLQLNSCLAVLLSHAEALRTALQKWATPFYWVRDCLVDGSFLALFQLAALSLGLFFAVTLLFSRFFKPLVSRLSARSARSDYQLGTLRGSSAFSALYKKELRRYFTCTMYLFNTGVGMVLLLFGAGYALVSREKLLALLEQLVSFGVDRDAVVSVLLMALCFLLGLTCVTAPSISLEGKQLWILKESPVSARAIFCAKLLLQMTITAPPLLLSLPCIGFALELSVFTVLTLFATGLLLSLLNGAIGLLINLKLPKLDGSNDTVIVKQSASVLCTLLASVVMVGSTMLLFRLLHTPLGNNRALLVLCALLAFATLLFFRLLNTRGKALFDALN